ncbi:MAG: hypothetical protein ACI97A_004040 [Planctomycetota bacterium]|jgi:hypothetical protein
MNRWRKSQAKRDLITRHHFSSRLLPVEATGFEKFISIFGKKMLISKFKRTLLFCFSGLMLTLICQGQIPSTYTFNGDSAADDFGQVGNAGDVNGDGFDDIVVGALRDDNNGVDSGSARVFSGKDGTILYTFDGMSAGDEFGVSVDGAGDVNGDGFDDLIVGAHRDDNNGAESGSATVFSGQDGSILHTFNGSSVGDFFGSSVSGAGDVNGDGFGDIIVGASRDDPNGGNSGSATVFSGLDGSVLFSFDGSNAGDQLGVSVSGAGDVNGDNFDDLVVGAPFDDNTGSSSGNATVFSGLDGSILHSLDGDSAGDIFGISVSGAGDVNDDGFDDIVVGAQGDDNNGVDSGNATVFSGQDGSVLHSFDGTLAGEKFGSSVSDAGDVNGDGFDDLVVGARRADNNGPDSGNATVFSGQDGSVLNSFDGDSALDRFGSSVCGVGDINGDGLDDIAVGAPGDDNNGASSGSVRVFYTKAPLSCLYSFDGDSISASLGTSVSDAGDVNGDGFDDVIVGTPNDVNNGIQSGSATVFSGLDGSVLYLFEGDSDLDEFGFSVSGSGDVNGDGFADVVVGAYRDDNTGNSSGSATVFSGQDGSVLHSFNGDSALDRFGRSVSGAGDVNGDGFDDFIVGAHGDDNNGSASGSITVFSGLDGSTLYSIDGNSASDFFGRRVSGAGDVNGDGFDDFIVGTELDDNNGIDSGNATVFSGMDGSTLHSLDGASAGDLFGTSVSGAGDVNGDGFDDFIVGSLLDDNNGIDSGSATVFSGLNGSVLHNRDGESAGDQFGSAVSGSGDVNGDGFDDVVVGALLADTNGIDSGSATVISGFDGSILRTINGDSQADRFGSSVSSAGDANGDGLDDIVVGAPLDDNNGIGSGTARVYTSNFVPLVDTIGQAPQPGKAVFDINGATNSRGLATDSGVVISAANGPYAATVSAGGPITFSWGGVPFTGVICLFGPQNDAVLSFPGVGQFDIGLLPIGGNGLPGAIGVFGDFNQFATSFHHAQFFCGAAGTGFVSYQLSPIFPPGFLTRFQCVMNPMGQFFMSNAVDVTVL